MKALLGVDLMEHEMHLEDVFRNEREVEVIDPLGVYRHQTRTSLLITSSTPSGAVHRSSLGGSDYKCIGS